MRDFLVATLFTTGLLAGCNTISGVNDFEVDRCSEDCPRAWLGDGTCDAECNTAACMWDFSDCEMNSYNTTDSESDSDRDSDSDSDSERDRDSDSDTDSGVDSDACVATCTTAMRQNDTCDESCMTQECGFDAGQCQGVFLVCSDNKTYIDQDKQCDGVNNCPSGFDELTCTSCAMEAKSIPLTQVCDGVKNCQYGSDEASCFACDDNADQLVFYLDTCDGTNDCADGSDEASCFTCAANRTIQFADFFRCDGVNNCTASDTSDEENCP